MAVIFDLSSLRGKITSAYITLVIIISVLGIIAVTDMLFLERQVTQCEIVSDLKDAVLEMRREEKNLFLYSDEDTLSRADGFAASSLEILHTNEATLRDIMIETDPLTMAASLGRYRDKLERWRATPGNDREALQEELRTLGHML